MKIHLVPLRVKSLEELKKWKFDYSPGDVLGIRQKCKLTKLSQFSFHGPRWVTWCGLPIYYNF